MSLRQFLLVAPVTTGLTLVVVPAAADPDPELTADPNIEGQIIIRGERTIPGEELHGITNTGPDGSETVSSYDDDLCGPNEALVETFQQMGVDDAWQLADSGCGGSATVGGREMLTPDMVLEAVRRIGLPSSSVEVPPETLVNFETTVYTVPVEFGRTVTLLGFTVDVRAQASRFAWHYGDGESEYTDSPGAPYPSDAITHTWEDAHRTFRPRVDTTYTVSYRVDGGPWLDLGDTVSVTGTESRVRIREAVPARS